MKNRCPAFCIGVHTANYVKTRWDVVIHLRHYYVRYVIVVSVVTYFIVMDVILYMTLQRTNNLQQQVPALYYSMFATLSVQSLMMDPIFHYMIQPTTELLEDVTNFRECFPFLRPDVFALVGVIIAISAVKCLVSGDLRIRRYGVLLFTLRTWIVTFEGVVYRSYMGWKYRYELHHKSMRYSIDVLCFVISAGLLCYAILHHLLKHQSKSQSKPALLLYSMPNNNVLSVNITSPRKTLLTVLSFTGLLLVCSVSWDLTVIKLTELLQSHKQVPSQYLQSLSTWTVFSFWRLLGGHALIHMLLIAIFIDKLWEFLSFMLYFGHASVIILDLFTVCHCINIEAALEMTSRGMIM